MQLLRTLVPVLLAAALPAAARADALIQIGFHGSVEPAAGARVEVEIGAQTEKGFREVKLAVHLARNTHAADLAALVARKLERAGIDFLQPAPPRDGRFPVTLFVEHARHVSVRLGRGLGATLVGCDGAPASVAIRRPNARASAGTLILGASTFHAHHQARGERSLSMELAEELRDGQIPPVLHKAAIEQGWILQSARDDGWRPMKMADGGTIESLSVEIVSDGDWRIEIELAPRER